MKRIFLILLGLLLAFPLSVRAMAADGPVITLQPQNPHYPEYSVAIYSVKAEGRNLTCTWYLEYEGTTYNISDNSNATEPWEGYAGSSYGPSRNGNTFHYIFNGIEDGLNGAKIYCVIEAGHNDVQSGSAIIAVMGSKMPPQISVPAKVSARIGEIVDLRCIATAPGNEQLTYIWYETHTGKLQDIIAMPGESEYSDYITCDTSAQGIRYYACCVQTSAGGMAYSSVIPVSVTGRPFEPQPAQKDISSVAITDIEAPETGKSPDCFATVGGEGYDFQKTNTVDSFGGISWYDVTEGRYIPLASEFVAGHEYQVYIELVTEGDYQFAYPDATVNGNAAEVFGNTGNITVCYVFPPCKEENASPPAAVPAEPEKPAVSSPASLASSVSPAGSSNTPSQTAPAPSSDTAPSASSEASDPEKPSEAQQPSSEPENVPVSIPAEKQSDSMPLWGVLLCAAAAMAAGVGITLAFISKKRNK